MNMQNQFLQKLEQSPITGDFKKQDLDKPNLKSDPDSEDDLDEES